jgi:uncharacterized protein YodC (DUF2158 family)
VVFSCFIEDLVVLGYSAVPLGMWLLMFVGIQCCATGQMAAHVRRDTVLCHWANGCSVRRDTVLCHWANAAHVRRNIVPSKSQEPLTP